MDHCVEERRESPLLSLEIHREQLDVAGDAIEHTKKKSSIDVVVRLYHTISGGHARGKLQAHLVFWNH
jgi:hypothetical protein